MNLLRLLFPIALVAPLIVHAAPAAAEHATYNSAGGLTSLITDGWEFQLKGDLVASFAGGVSATLQPHDQRAPITREGTDLHWKGLATFPNGGQAQFENVWLESGAGIMLEASAVSGGPVQPGAPPFRFPLQVESVDYVIDLPRTSLQGWTIEATGQQFPSVKPANPIFFSETTGKLAFTDGQKNWKLALTLDQPRAVSITDLWEGDTRVYRVRIQLGSGLWPVGDTWKLGLTLALTGTAHAPAAHLTIDPSAPRYAFDGFGGNYCFATATPAAGYLLENLHHAWARLELKGQVWDHERHTKPGAMLESDFQLMQRVQQKGLPWVISLWRLPERYYADANQKAAFTFGRQIATERWPEFLDLIGSYLLYLKKNYNAEPDLFSFNEPDLGVNIGFTGETHRDAIKRIGAHLVSLGLKTKMLLGDTANPRDSHRYVLPAAADAEAMRYVGAVSFHSWGNGTPAQYGAWGDVGSWLHLPLLVGEAGTDPGSWRNRMFDSYAYGLGEMRQYQELLRDSRPSTILFWQFTEDYGIVNVNADKTIEPTGRFWLMKHFTNLTPLKSNTVASTSDQPEVLVSAFARDRAVTVHILNSGPARDANLTGLSSGTWRTVTTTESKGFQEGTADPAQPLRLPARSLTTLVRDR